MEKKRYEQLHEILAIRILPELREIRRRQAVLVAVVWIGQASLLAGMVVILGLIGVLIGR